MEENSTDDASCMKLSHRRNEHRPGDFSFVSCPGLEMRAGVLVFRACGGTQNYLLRECLMRPLSQSHTSV